MQSFAIGRRRDLLGALALVSLLFCGAGPAAAQQKFMLQLARPVKIGDQTFVTQHAKQETIYKTLQGDRVLKENKRTAELNFQGTIETLAVDATGNETRIRIQIDNFTAKLDDASATDAFKPGSVVLAETVENKTVYRMIDSQEPLPTTQQGFMSRLFVTSTGEPTDDEIFAVTEPQAVGGTWPANEELLLKRLLDFDPKLTTEKISGTGELLEAPLVDGKQWFHVKFSIHADSDWPQGGPPETVPLAAELNVVVTIRLPADAAMKATVDRTLDVRRKMQFNGKPDSRFKGLTLQLESHETRESKTVDR